MIQNDHTSDDQLVYDSPALKPCLSITENHILCQQQQKQCCVCLTPRSLPFRRCQHHWSGCLEFGCAVNWLPLLTSWPIRRPWDVRPCCQSSVLFVIAVHAMPLCFRCQISYHILIYNWIYVLWCSPCVRWYVWRMYGGEKLGPF